MPAWVETGFTEYQRRFPRDMPLELIEIPAGKRGKNADIKRILQLEGEKIRLELEDFLITASDLEGWSVANNKGLTAALDTSLTKDLLNEGDAREFINRLQNLRKTNDFDVTDKILVKVKPNQKFENVLKTYKTYICSEILAKDIVIEANFSNEELLDINDNELIVNIEKI